MNDVNQFDRYVLQGKESNLNLSYGIFSFNGLIGTSSPGGVYYKNNSVLYKVFTFGWGLGKPSLILSDGENNISNNHKPLNVGR